LKLQFNPIDLEKRIESFCQARKTPNCLSKDDFVIGAVTYATVDAKVKLMKKCELFPQWSSKCQQFCREEISLFREPEELMCKHVSREWR